MDIVQKIKKIAPSALDTFQVDTERRAALTDKSITGMLSNIFKNIDYSNLSPEMEFKYHEIRNQL